MLTFATIMAAELGYLYAQISLSIKIKSRDRESNQKLASASILLGWALGKAVVDDDKQVFLRLLI